MRAGRTVGVSAHSSSEAISREPRGGEKMSDTIQVKLPDGSIKQFPKGATALDVAKSISPRLADAAIAAQARAMSNGDEPRLIDLTRPIEKDTEIRILTEKDPESLEVFRHSSAHLLAAAV